jgi:hypothetical protein
MTFTLIMLRVFCSVKIINKTAIIIGSCKKMTSITELKLSTTLSLNSFTKRKRLAKHINNDNFIRYSNYQMESTWMESNSISFIWNYLRNF